MLIQHWRILWNTISIVFFLSVFTHRASARFPLTEYLTTEQQIHPTLSQTRSWIAQAIQSEFWYFRRQTQLDNFLNRWGVSTDARNLMERQRHLVWNPQLGTRLRMVLSDPEQFFVQVTPQLIASLPPAFLGDVYSFLIKEGLLPSIFFANETDLINYCTRWGVRTPSGVLYAKPIGSRLIYLPITPQLSAPGREKYFHEDLARMLRSQYSSRSLVWSRKAAERLNSHLAYLFPRVGKYSDCDGPNCFGTVRGIFRNRTGLDGHVGGNEFLEFLNQFENLGETTVLEPGDTLVWHEADIELPTHAAVVLGEISQGQVVLAQKDSLSHLSPLTMLTGNLSSGEDDALLQVFRPCAELLERSNLNIFQNH